jgi:cell division protein FtsB
MTTVDRRFSKRPVADGESATTESLVQRREQLKERLRDLDDQVQSQSTSPEYQRVVADSVDRLHTLAWEGMQIAPDDALAHAALMGQFNERLKLLGEMEELHKKQNVLKKNIDSVAKSLLKLTRKLRNSKSEGE